MKLAQSAATKIRYLVIVLIFIIGLFAIVGSGGPRYRYSWAPFVQKSSNDYFEAHIRPLCPDGCTSFLLSIENKTAKDLELDWNKTLYITNGSTSGGFMFEGVVYLNRNNPKPPDIIFANSSLSKQIWPSILVSFSGNDWYNNAMPIGENGVYLTVRADGKEIREKMVININREQLPSSGNTDSSQETVSPEIPKSNSKNRVDVGSGIKP